MGSVPGSDIHNKVLAVVEEAKTWLGTPFSYIRRSKGEGTCCLYYIAVSYRMQFPDVVFNNSMFAKNRVLPSVEEKVAHLIDILNGMNFDTQPVDRCLQLGDICIQHIGNQILTILMISADEGLTVYERKGVRLIRILTSNNLSMIARKH